MQPSRVSGHRRSPTTCVRMLKNKRTNAVAAGKVDTFTQPNPDLHPAWISCNAHHLKMSKTSGNVDSMNKSREVARKKAQNKNKEAGI